MSANSRHIWSGSNLDENSLVVQSADQKRVLKPESSNLSMDLWLLKEALVIRLVGLPSLLSHTFLEKNKTSVQSEASLPHVSVRSSLISLFLLELLAP